MSDVERLSCSQRQGWARELVKVGTVHQLPLFNQRLIIVRSCSAESFPSHVSHLICTPSGSVCIGQTIAGMFMAAEGLIGAAKAVLDATHDLKNAALKLARAAFGEVIEVQAGLIQDA